MKTPNYVLMEDVSYTKGVYSSGMLPKGTFVRPVELGYMPKHVVDDERWRWFNKEKDVFVYCSIGFIVVPKSSLREV